MRILIPDVRFGMDLGNARLAQILQRRRARKSIIGLARADAGIIVGA